MAMIGADVAALRELAQTCARASDTVQAVSKRVDATLGELRWRGPDVDAFRSEWGRSGRLRLAQVAVALGETARILRENATQQQRASAAATGETPASSGSTAAPDAYGKGSQAGNAAPRGADQYWETLRNMRGDTSTGSGYRIQVVEGDDGRYRMVVYINGTGQGENLTKGANIDAIQGRPTAETTAVESAMAQAMKTAEANGTPISQVMLVGYSQGGMIAQEVAGTGTYPVSTVLTYGSPVIETSNDYGGAQMIRITDTADVVPGGIAPGAAEAGRDIASWRDYFEGKGIDTTGSNNLDFSSSDPEASRDKAAVDQSYADEMKNPVTAPFVWLGSEAAKQTYTLTDHGSTWMYGDDARSFDADQSARARAAQESISRFGGTVITDTE